MLPAAFGTDRIETVLTVCSFMRLPQAGLRPALSGGIMKDIAENIKER